MSLALVMMGFKYKFTAVDQPEKEDLTTQSQKGRGKELK